MSFETKTSFTLGDGLLNDDLDYLDNQKFYPEKIILNSANDLLYSINTEDQNITIPSNSNQISILCSRLIQSSRRGIHIVLKWLVYLHEIINQNQCLKILQAIYQGLSKLNIDHTFTCSSNYDKYLKKLLVKPYLQYLMKLTILLIQEIQQKKKQKDIFLSPRSPTKNIATQNILRSKKKKSNANPLDDDQGSQRSPKRRKSPISRLRRQTLPLITNYQQTLNENKNWYQKYNLIIFILQEFYKPINEFNGYFSEFYQYLNNFICFIQNNVKEFYRAVKKQYNSHSNKQLQLISLIEMDSLSDKISNFMKLGIYKSFQKSLFTQLQQIEFLESDRNFQDLLKSSQKIQFFQHQFKDESKITNPQAYSKQDTNDSKDSKQFYAKNKKFKKQTEKQEFNF